MFYNLKINFNLFVGLGYDYQKCFSFLLFLLLPLI